MEFCFNREVLDSTVCQNCLLDARPDLVTYLTFSFNVQRLPVNRVICFLHKTIWEKEETPPTFQAAKKSEEKWNSRILKKNSTVSVTQET